ncbi:twin-arginine translocase subunit TatC [Desulfobulbus sp.]|uniref:twin-arginine translocase subunit TatC n=1 Tax=Desulfobulbus sp. TaxID=895 RepID=UPI0027BACDFA|nr:twin-arginine translocase subunit TatC [Desulfobulbus sp.]
MAEPLKLFAIFLLELGRSLKLLGMAIAALTLSIFFLSGRMLSVFQAHLGEKLYFFSVAGPFLAHVKMAFFGALYVLMPLCMHVLWKALGKPFGVIGKKLFWFVAATCFLFYSGTIFCYMLTLPLGIKFLLGFQSQDLQAVISITRFVNFVTLFILGFGLVFELPVFMVFSAQVGAVSRAAFARNRRYAVLVIAILAALLTPTPDLVNMGLMGLPLYLLYESGILLIGMLGLDKATHAVAPSNEGGAS